MPRAAEGEDAIIAVVPCLVHRTSLYTNSCRSGQSTDAGRVRGVPDAAAGGAALEGRLQGRQVGVGAEH